MLYLTLTKMDIGLYAFCNWTLHKLCGANCYPSSILEATDINYLISSSTHWKWFDFAMAHISHKGWPRKNATLTINNFRKMGDRMKKLCALLHIKFFSLQDDTKIVNFDEGVLILWPFFWGNVIFKICPSISKVTIYIPKIFHCLASPGKVSALTL